MNRERELEAYLHRQIPLSAAMQVSVMSAEPGAVILAAPLEPNINHKHTVFGGSASAVAILAAWAVVHTRLAAEGLASEVVIQSNHMDYDLPIEGSFTARGFLPDPAAWGTFTKILARMKRARIEVHSELSRDGAVAGRLSGRFVAFLR